MIKKICFFAGHYDPSRQAIMSYFEKIFPKDIEFFLVCAKDFDYEKYPLKRTKVTELHTKNFLAIFKLRKFCKENDIDLVTNLSGEETMALTLIFVKLCTKTKNLFYFLGNPKFGLKTILYIISQFFTNRFIACGENVAKKYNKIFFLRREKISYVPLPININKFKIMDKKKLRKQLGFKEDDKLIISPARINLSQGSDILLKLIKENPDKKFLLIGYVMDENYRNHSFKNLTLIPFVPHKEIPKYYNLADLCIFLIKRTTYAYPPRESMACGVPIIVSDIDSFKPITTPAAIKVPFDVDKIQEEIDRFFSLSKKEKEKLSKDGRNFVINDCSEERIKDKTLKSFLEI